ncbi:J domain-containing protein [Pseudonocardia sp. ICBG1293]|uniref:J domain-containing protein n=1 Tax=Pseudonocardia sp. ICBG1293 TaxID=2844382 RepID=UPI001CCF6D5B|nr:J domain-containing protein [Pseudonocardia sp. ICBG1293]
MTTLSREAAAQRLKVSPAASPQDLHSAYRKAARAHHPDIGGSKEEFQNICDAYTYLLAEAWVDTPEESRPDPARGFGPVVWVRSKFTFLAIVLGMVEAAVLILIPIFIGVAFYSAVVTLVATALTIRLDYLAIGRPLSKKTTAEGAESDQGWDTGPIPTMTAERMERFERDGY